MGANPPKPLELLIVAGRDVKLRLIPRGPIPPNLRTPNMVCNTPGWVHSTITDSHLEVHAVVLLSEFNDHGVVFFFLSIHHDGRTVIVFCCHHKEVSGRFIGASATYGCHYIPFASHVSTNVASNTIRTQYDLIARS